MTSRCSQTKTILTSFIVPPYRSNRPSPNTPFNAPSSNQTTPLVKMDTAANATSSESTSQPQYSQPLPYRSPVSRSRTQQVPPILITEVLHPRDARRNSPEFTAFEKKELQGLFQRKTWKIVFKDEVPRDERILEARFVLTLKDTETENPLSKARFVSEGHRDRDKYALVNE